jgi:methylase of polypeptide subunit release factors
MHPLYKKTISYKCGPVALNFAVSQELFSSQSVDHGTQRLLRIILLTDTLKDLQKKVAQIASSKADNNKASLKILDLGCGYGPIGLSMKAAIPEAEVHLVDRDALALEFTKINAEANNLAIDTSKNSKHIFASLGYSNVQDTDYDVILSNIPAKVGEPMLIEMLFGAKKHLKHGGIVGVVVIDAIADFVHEELKKAVKSEQLEIIKYKSWPGHHVYWYRFLADAFEQTETWKIADESFVRNSVTFDFRKYAYQAHVSYDLPEFDELTFETELLFDALWEHLEELFTYDGKVTLACLNPGQGYVPIVLAGKAARKRTKLTLDLFSRDLLALVTTQKNLTLFGESVADQIKRGVTKQVHDLHLKAFHTASFLADSGSGSGFLADSGSGSGLSADSGSGKKYNAVIGKIPEKLSLEFYEDFFTNAIAALADRGLVIISSTSTTISRLLELEQVENSFHQLARFKQKGWSSVVLRKK